MPKRSPGERWRYIAFRIEGAGAFSRSEFLDALLYASRTSCLGDSFRITVFENNLGILKVPHTLKDEAIKVLGSMDTIRGSPCEVTTLRTSGTIKTLKAEYRTIIERPVDESR